MNPTRRTFLSALAALPLVGWIVPKVKAAPPAIKTVKWYETRHAATFDSSTGAWRYDNCRWRECYADESVGAWQSAEKAPSPPPQTA